MVVHVFHFELFPEDLNYQLPVAAMQPGYSQFSGKLIYETGILFVSHNPASDW